MRRAWLTAVLLMSATAAACRGEHVFVREQSDSVAVEATGYDPDSLRWLVEGRPVDWDARAWRPIGQPVHYAAAELRRVGEFEGMMLYELKQKEAPDGRHLFFPLGNEMWQPLESYTPSSTGTGSAPE